MSVFSDVEYIGFDNNHTYIEFAKKRFGTQGHFFCGTVDKANLKEFDTFDLVLAVGVLHHLDDQECIKALELAYSALKKGGRLISLDGCFVDEQSKAAKFIISKDRGLFMRKKREYQELAAKVFSGVDVNLRHDLLKIPYTHSGVSASSLAMDKELSRIVFLSLIHISEPTRTRLISYAVYC